MQVSVKKSVAVAYRPRLADKVVALSTTNKLHRVSGTKTLGAPSGGGRRRFVKPAVERIKTQKARLKRYRTLRRQGVNTSVLMRTAGCPSMLYGTEVMGVADGQLKSARSTGAAAIAGDAGGTSPDLVLLFADASGARTDPAYEAHATPVKHWALAWWEKRQPRDDMIGSFNQAVARLRNSCNTVWNRVAGSTAALIGTIWRLSWVLLSPSRCLTDAGEKVDFECDTPACITQLVCQSVRRRQLARAAAHYDHLLPPGRRQAMPRPGLLPAKGPAVTAPRPYHPTRRPHPGFPRPRSVS